jgi:LysM repeat protein
MTFFFAAFTAALAICSAVNAAPLSLARRCDVPGVDNDAVDTAYRTCMGMDGCNHLVVLSMIDTCIQESNCNPLNCGDKDSVGMYQQRPSQGWGTVAQCEDPAHSTRSYLAVAIPYAQRNPGAPAHQVAMFVQGAEAGDLYSHDEEALQILQGAADRTGIPLPGSSGSNPKPASSSKKPAPASSTPAPAVTVEGAGNVGAAPKSSSHKTSTAAPAEATPDDEGDECPSESGSPASCKTWYTPKSGDTCIKVSTKFGISLANFYKWNTQLDHDCQNLEVTFAYCVKD